MSWLGVIWPQARGGLAVHNSSTRAMEKKLASQENNIIMALDKKMPEASGERFGAKPWYYYI